MFQQGMTFVCDGQPSRFTKLWRDQKELVQRTHAARDVVDMPDRTAVFERIHGREAVPRSTDALVSGTSRWNVAYCNLKAAFIDAEASIRIYHERCLQQRSISFMCGSAVKRIRVVEGAATGVVMEGGKQIDAELVLVAAGAWSNRLVHLEQRVTPISHEVAWIKVTPEEEKRWGSMSITTNLSTGLNMFPPYHGEIKILRRSPGYKNTITIQHPEDVSSQIEISHPRTIVTNPTDVVPLDAEIAMRNDLKEIMPALADRPFDRTKLCWYVASPSCFSKP